jgi:hypothetical protein
MAAAGVYMCETDTGSTDVRAKQVILILILYSITVR